MTPQRIHVAQVCLLLLLVAAAPTPAEAAPSNSPPAAAPIAPYPTAAPQPVGDSRLPIFVDDDELVVAQLAPNGSVVSMLDDITLKLNGQGDFDIHMLEPVKSVTDRGGESPPGLLDGRVTFQGSLFGPKLANAEAVLDVARARPAMALAARMDYSSGGHPLQAGHFPAAPAVVDETIRLDNLTGRDRTVVRGEPTPGAGIDALAKTLEALRQVAPLYTPEIDLQATFPLPRSIPLRPPVTVQAARIHAPFIVTVIARFDKDARILDPGGGTPGETAGGRKLTWTFHLPVQPLAAGTASLRISYASATPASIDILATPFPYAQSLFTAPSGTWATHLRAPGAPAANLVVLAQAATLSLNQVADLVAPVGRPGPGPVQVRYQLLYTPPAAPARAARGEPARPQPLAVVGALLGLVLVGANAWWAWSRH